ncbi:DUF4190 domain-containing protein [Saccharopolyspora rhizosphaerae]|uniref:DUF4190 domain-containing protein n=1 Tax=Saccharopolyspora rhizosphaerae TaxID=2492662 RepID=A0A3R8Q4W7_9PSEU|nr:DUF4190 domain-containing protein [Saccharopolyspora rhizosphaerae]RRO16995.1 DUF4190 domain-containing protein [Saccharopolyspora rhizosphaerae]
MSTQQPPPASGDSSYSVTPMNGIGVAALVLGIVGFLMSLLPLIGVVAWPMVVLGLIFGVVGIMRARRKIATNLGMAVAGTVLSALGLVVCIVYAASFSYYVATTPPPSGSMPGATQDDSETAVQVGFDQPYTFSGGETITISRPVEHPADNPYADAPTGERLVQTTVTVHNGTGRPFNAASVGLTAQHRGQVASQSYLNSDAIPDVEIPPGGNVSFHTVWEISSEPGELRISAKPTIFAHTTAYWVGQA